MRVSAAEFARGLELLDRDKPKPMAVCPGCEEPTPLISTLAFRFYEFYCLECGGGFGFLEPRVVEGTPELDLYYVRLQAEWDEHAGRRLIIEGRTPVSERAAVDHNEAVVWLLNRRKR